MPLQNRVTPFGSIIADPVRGAWMGNRGRLHGDNRTLTCRRWTTKAWLVCQLSFKDRRRVPMTPGRYTELFFLDEATALAAGHRPCWECRRQDSARFHGLFAAASGQVPGRVRAADLDAALHAERVVPMDHGSRRTGMEGLPDGVFVASPGDPAVAWLVHKGRLWPWSPAGYGTPMVSPGGEAILITPATTAAVLAKGYLPQIHPSAAD